MIVRIGLEKNYDEQRSLVWALDYPGCFAYGDDEASAVAAFPQALLAYRAWVERCTADSWLKALGDFDVRLVDAWQVYQIDESYQVVDRGRRVHAWFRHDWLPLTAREVQRYALLLRWGRAELLSAAGGLTPAQLAESHPGERWSIGGILAHVASSQVWLLERIDRAGISRASLPDEPLERLGLALARLEEALPTLAGLEYVTGKEGEFWSPRKVLRRAIWHELDHAGHIRKLRPDLSKN